MLGGLDINNIYYEIYLKLQALGFTINSQLGKYFPNQVVSLEFSVLLLFKFYFMIDFEISTVKIHLPVKVELKNIRTSFLGLPGIWSKLPSIKHFKSSDLL